MSWLELSLFIWATALTLINLSVWGWQARVNLLVKKNLGLLEMLIRKYASRKYSGERE